MATKKKTEAIRFLGKNWRDDGKPWAAGVKHYTWRRFTLTVFPFFPGMDDWDAELKINESELNGYGKTREEALQDLEKVIRRFASLLPVEVAK